MFECEVSSRKILPAIRKELVTQLIKEGKKQNEIARILEVTPAAITQYVKGKRGKIDLTTEEKKAIKKITKKIVNNTFMNEKALCEICEKIRNRIV